MVRERERRSERSSRGVSVAGDPDNGAVPRRGLVDQQSRAGRRRVGWLHGSTDGTVKKTPGRIGEGQKKKKRRIIAVFWLSDLFDTDGWQNCYSLPMA